MPPDNKTGPSSLNEALSNGLGGIIERAELIDALDRQLRQSLPGNLASRCRLANVDTDRLVFLVDSPIWKTRLRLHTDDLLAAAATLGLKVRELTIKVSTTRFADGAVEPRTTAHPPRVSSPDTPLSQAARRHLDEAATAVGDPELRGILRRLASLPDPQ
ncbi:MAG: DciA family protein [Lysobacteraceae bacterium]